MTYKEFKQLTPAEQEAYIQQQKEEAASCANS